MEILNRAVDFSDFPKIDLYVAAAVGVFLLVFPALPHSGFTMATMIQFLMFSVYGMGWNTIGGYGGQVDLGKAQYVGIGAYTTAVMMIRWDVPFWVSLPIGMALAVGWSFVIGYPLFRLKGPLFCDSHNSDFLGPQGRVRILVVHRRGQGPEDPHQG